MRHPLATISLAIAAALILFAPPLHADNKPTRNNRFHIDDRLYAIYQDATMAARNAKKSDAALELADSMFRYAVRLGDVKAQCLSFEPVVNYYITKSETNPKATSDFRKSQTKSKVANDDIRTAIQQQRDFASKTPYKQYMFGGWGRYILHIAEQNDPSAIEELEEYRRDAMRHNNYYGILRSYDLYSVIYNQAGLKKNAIEVSKQGLNYVMTADNGIHAKEAYLFHYKLADYYFDLQDYEHAMEHAEQAISSPYTGSGVYMSCLYTKSRIHYIQKKYDSMRQDIMLYEQKIDKTARRPARNNLKTLQVLYYATALHDIVRATNICQTIDDETNKKYCQETIYKEKRDYKALCGISKRDLKLSIDEYKLNEEAQNKIYTDSIIKHSLADMRRQEVLLNNEKLRQEQLALQAEAEQHQTQLERLQQATIALEAEKQQIERDNQRKEIVRQQLKLSTILREDSIRNEEARSTEIKRQTEKVRIVSIVILLLIATGYLMLMAYNQNKRIRAVRRRRETIRESIRHKQSLIEGLQDDILDPINSMQRQAQIFAREQADSQPISPDGIANIHKWTGDITTLIDQLIANAESKGGEAATARP